MKVSLSLQFTALVLGGLLVCAGQPAYAGSPGGAGNAGPPGPTATPQNKPAATPQPKATRASFVTVRGTACIDNDLNGLCAPEEGPVPNVAVRGANGAVTATNQMGRFEIVIPPRSELEITIPAGFRSVNGNLRHLRMQLLEADRIDIALARDPTYAAGAGQIVAVNSSDLQLIYVALVALGTIMLIMFGALISFKHIFQKSVAYQKLSLREQRAKDLAVKMQSALGWQAVAEQVVADALRTHVSIDGNAGILEATAEPNPRFTIVTRDGQAIVFTTNPRLLRKAKLIRRKDRVVDVTAMSATSHVDVDMLWRYIVGLRNMGHISSPISAHWYVVARTQAAKPTRTRWRALPKPAALRRVPWLRGGHT